MAPVHILNLYSANVMLFVLQFASFRVDPESGNYTLHLGAFMLGTAGHGGACVDTGNMNGMQFTSYDRDNDLSGINCASTRHGAWWYNSCDKANFNSILHTDSTYTENRGIEWDTKRQVIHQTRMQIKPIYVDGIII